MRQTPAARFSSLSRRRQWAIIILAVFLAAAVLAGAYLLAQKLERDALGGEEPKGSLVGRFDDPLRAEHDGKTYEQKQRLTGILLMGLDEGAGEGASVSGETGIARADLMMLVVIDSLEKAVTTIHIDPDTLADITTTGDFDDAQGIRRAQIGRQYAYGDSRLQGAALSAQAVGRLFGGVSVDIYILLDSGAMAALNDALGGLEVRIEDDLTALDPAMTAGSVLKLSGKQAEYFVKGKAAADEDTAQARFARQKVFLGAAGRALAAKLLESPGYANTLVSTLQPVIHTNTNISRIVFEMYSARAYTRESAALQGENRTEADGSRVFEAGRASLDGIIFTLFYKEVE